jgi:hypothetical protein
MSWNEGTKKKLIKIDDERATRLSGTGSFPAPKKDDVGRTVVIYREAMSWPGVLGYFEGDKPDHLYAFYKSELG